MTATAIDPDALTLDALRDGLLRDRPVTVLGLARSGLALARFLADVGARVTVYDARPPDELASTIEQLGGREIRLLLGPDVDPVRAWADADLVTSSPSIHPDYPTTEPRLRAALRALVARRAAGDDAPAVLWEADLFVRLCPAPTIGVTGTKGKTTTAALTHAILAADSHHRAVLGGNIGVPLVERLPELRADDRVVVELSELQIPTLSRGTDLAVFTNVTADHLDRHGSLAAYRAVKRRLATLTRARGGSLVLNADDPFVAGLGDGEPADRVVRYSSAGPVPGGVGLVDGWIVADGVGPVLPIDELAIPGRHNVSNALAAVAVGLRFGVPPAAIRGAAAGFHGVEHRLETVAVVDGIRYVNDSQGTQPDAVIAALRAFDGPIVLIAGGRDKGVDLSGLAEVAAERASAAVLIGESAADLARLFGAAGLLRIERAATIEDALDRATALADELSVPSAADRTDVTDAGDGAGAGAVRAGAGAVRATVLLSPAAASFDMFADYEARGRAFKAAVAAIRDRSAGR